MRTPGTSTGRLPIGRRLPTCPTVMFLLVFGVTGLSGQTLDRAEALWRAHDYDGANNAFKALVAAQPKNADYRARWGDLFYERFNPMEAGNLYQEALGIDPKNARALLGMAQLEADNYDPK